jgi:1,5-anhydro-D-fructose reductase (1,5-anhydro-D-mannitol-forming)
MPSRRIGWGIIGTTSWADHTFAPAIQAAENAEQKAALSSSAAKADSFCQKHKIPKAYSTLSAFLNDPDVEAVWIASPNHLHAEQAIEALRRGKHVLVEKPMAVAVADCEAMVGLADQQKRVLGVGYHLRQHPFHRRLHEEWKQGAFGVPASVRVQLYYAYPSPPSEWRRLKGSSGGWALGDIGTHLVDALRWFLGDAESVHAELGSPRFGYETEDFAQLSIRFRSGAVGVADASTGAGGPPPRLELYGTEGYCICEGTFFGQGGQAVRCLRDGKARTEQVQPVNLYKLQVEEFGRAVRGDSVFSATGADGLANVIILSQARGW